MTDTVLRVENLFKSFGALRATNDVSLDLRAGEIHALIGPNGAGKSTLIQQITGHLASDSGRVFLMEEDLAGIGPAGRARRGLGRTFQISSLAMEHTVLQNAVLGALGRRGHAMSFFKPVMKDVALLEAAHSALDQVGLAQHGAVRTADLSHGQRRQLEVAVALTLRPKVFLMDEPMAGLGLEGAQQMIGLLTELRNSAPILLIEHDMDAVFALADRISVLVYGEVIATGTPDEIRVNPEIRRAYLGDDVPL
ncbi:ABC transporter ATP-binding protein [Shimia marina]|uniref:Lipopolysaccharide export system ATP-binding protein LptB n=1 Tax=Shimia marina TaxID=321267 RepID=A0A0P1EU43_9RHOB|nr:ABC transporter ATP-binding protein [Shimia marina]CUH53591.1 Lipopolysaccharide export system ATP-binding protein LptB [Shimia marina]SFD73405.1 amino acid/amide ABC transporter ATP-binding protein 1, HAAT family [Shimia marina]